MDKVFTLCGGAEHLAKDCKKMRAEFERAYAEKWKKETFKDQTIEELVCVVESMREGDGYGDRVYLNGMWHGWQAAHATRSAPVCQTCNGHGVVGGHVGQTPESFDYVSEPCPDCSAPAGSWEAVADAVQLLEQHQKWMNKLPVPTTGALHQMMNVVGKAISLLHPANPCKHTPSYEDGDVCIYCGKTILDDQAKLQPAPDGEAVATVTDCVYSGDEERFISATVESKVWLEDGTKLYTRPAPDARLVEALENIARLKAIGRKSAQDCICEAKRIAEAALAAAGKE